jgi:hypothetical protein
MAVIRDCELCGNRGCSWCEPTPQENLQMLHDALDTLSDGADNVVSLDAARAAKSGIYPTDDPRNFKPNGGK